MKLLSVRLLCLMLLASTFAKSQNISRLDLTGGLGAACYLGDLIQNDHAIFDQPSWAISGGVAYHVSPKWTWVSEVSFLRVRAADKKNSSPALRARNLSFKSDIWNINSVAEYDIWDLEAGHSFTPYAFVGIGLFHFNPFTTDRFGKQMYLEPLGTEGQGLAAYPDRTPYNLTQLELPVGIGFKYKLNRNVNLQLEFRYHYIDTDYLDDVSSTYPSLAVINAANPNLHNLTYRGDELPGGAPYPAAGSVRGNPNNKDSYYTTQIKFAYRLKSPKKTTASH